MGAGNSRIIVMTSGAFTAPYLSLLPGIERATRRTVVTAATDMGDGEDSIPERLRRGEAADVIIIADGALSSLIASGHIKAGSRTPLARSAIGMAIREGAVLPDISSVHALKRTLLAARSVAYSASVSGNYIATELFARLGIAGQMHGKCLRIKGRVGHAVADGRAEIGFQQISALLPIKGITFAGTLPAEVQRVSVFAAGITRHASDALAAGALIRFLASTEAAGAIRHCGLEPA